MSMEEVQKIKSINTVAAGIPHSQETLPAVEVDNELLWLNPVFAGLPPFNMNEGQLGQRARLVLFFDPHHHNEPAFELGVRKGHTRSGDFGKVAVTTAEGQRYHEIDLKGCGGVDFSAEKAAASFAYGNVNGDGLHGLLTRKKAEQDSAFSELFTKNGIRTHRSIAIFGLKEIPVPSGHTPLSVEALKEKGFEPVIQMRAFGTKTRVSELFSDQVGLSRGERVAALQNAFALVSQEFPGTVSDIPSYIHWFAETLGTNVGKIHALGYVHGSLSGHNITLDCRVTDLSDVVSTVEASSEGGSVQRRRKDAAGIDTPGKKERYGPIQAIELLISRVKESFPDDETVQGVEVSEAIATYKDSYQKSSGLPFPGSES